MADSYSQIYIHVTFSVRNRRPVLSKKWRENLFKYITGITNNKKQLIISINGVEDHIHILLRLFPNVALADIIRDIKANSTRYINENNFVAGKFEWQNEYGAFSVAHKDVPVAKYYISIQEEHHHVKTFKEEYMELLEENEIEYKQEYVFDPD